MGAWRQAVKQDSSAAYYRFLRDHPRSWYAERAQARIEYHKLQRHPSIEGFTKFKERFPKSELLAEIEPLFEQTAFSTARATGTPAAYASFLERFPEGAMASRAAGNAAFLQHRGFDGNPGPLESFAAEHPESDFAAEARRSAESTAQRASSGFDRIGLKIQISAETPEADRIAKAFKEAATKRYATAGIALVPISELHDEAGSSEAASARLIIQHSEGERRTQLSEGQLSRPAIIAQTRVMLQVGADGPSIWDRGFSARVNPRDHRPNTSLLFGPVGRAYWEEFFVPVATWQSKAAVREALELDRTIVDVDAVGDRSVVLFEDGDFRFLQLADPSAPETLVEYHRPDDQKRFQGVSLVAGSIVLYGDDGFEVVRFGATGPEVVGGQGREQVGAISAVAALGENLILAGSRGLLVARGDGAEPRRILRSVVRGLAVIDETLLFTDGESVMLSSLPLLREDRLQAQLRLGRDFGPARVRVFGRTAVVIGDGGLLVVDMTRPESPRVVSQLYRRVTGPVTDVTQIKGRLFVLGDRGLQLLDPTGQQVVESIDVRTAENMVGMGRHMVMVGGKHLQVVDATPFTARPTPAAPGTSDPAPADVESEEPLASP